MFYRVMKNFIYRLSMVILLALVVNGVIQDGSDGQFIAIDPAANIKTSFAPIFSTAIGFTKHSSNSNRNTGFVLVPTFPDPKFEAKTPEECENFARDFVYEYNACGGATDPQSYAAVALGRLTCRHRCGVAPTTGRSWAECGCDELCVVYSYCCLDVDTQCPDHYRKGQELASYARKKELISICYVDRMTLEPGYFLEKGHTKVSLFTTPGWHYPITFVPKSRPRGFQEVTLKDFVRGLQHYIVADLSKGILYGYRHFSSLEEPGSVPHFIPMGTGLKCPHMPLPRIEHISIANLFTWCDKDIGWHLQTSLDRDCNKDMFVGCGCGNRTFINSFLHDLCLAPNTSSQFKVENVLDLKFRDKENIQLAPENKCQVFRNYDAFDQSDIVYEGIEYYLTTTPVVLTAPWRASRRGPQFNEELGTVLKNRRAGDQEGLGSVERTPDIFDNVYLVIESPQTLETRLLCPDRSSLLSECRLAQCTPRALFSSRQEAPWKFSGRSCELPRRAVVTSLTQHRLPVCLCMRVLVAVRSLQKWRASMSKPVEGECQMDLDLLYRAGVAKPRTFYTFPSNLSQLITEPSPLADLKDRVLTSLMTTKHLCNAWDDTGDIRVCFYAAQAEENTVEGAIDCLDLGAVSAGEKRSALGCVEVTSLVGFYLLVYIDLRGIIH